MNRTIKLLTIGLSLSLSAVAGARDVDHKWCPPETPVPPAPVAQTERVNLSADALFRFDKAASTDLLPAGKTTLDKLGDALRTEYAVIDGISLVGHTDRLGNDKYNYNLGLQRAKTVKSYLQNLGVTAPISVASAGETQPTTNCPGTKATAELKACLQPDRRVSVDITGTRKK